MAAGGDPIRRFDSMLPRLSDPSADFPEFETELPDQVGFEERILDQAGAVPEGEQVLLHGMGLEGLSASSELLWVCSECRNGSSAIKLRRLESHRSRIFVSGMS